MSHLARGRLIGTIPAFVATALIVFLNWQGRHKEFQRGAWGPNERTAYGWPEEFYAENKYLKNEAAVFSDAGSLTEPRAVPVWDVEFRFEPNYLLVDIAVALLIVLVVWLITVVVYLKWDDPLFGPSSRVSPQGHASLE
jgi:hypothetical protein